MQKAKYLKILDHFISIDQIIYEPMSKVNFDNWFKDSRQKHDGYSYFMALTREIIGQQLSGKAASAIDKRFLDLFKNRVVDPEKLLAMEDQTLRDIGMSWAKASYVKNIARAFIDKTVDFENFDKLEDEEIVRDLTTIKGVGNWTAEMFLMFTLGREDVFSYGDLGLKKGFEKLYKINAPSRDQIQKVTNKWRPFRTYGSIALWESLENR